MKPRETLQFGTVLIAGISTMHCGGGDDRRSDGAHVASSAQGGGDRSVGVSGRAEGGAAVGALQSGPSSGFVGVTLTAASTEGHGGLSTLGIGGGAVAMGGGAVGGSRFIAAATSGGATNVAGHTDPRALGTSGGNNGGASGGTPFSESGTLAYAGTLSRSVGGACDGAMCASCTIGAFRCNGNDVETCNSVGVWTRMLTCACECVGDLAARMPTCLPRRCNGTAVEDCSANGTWNHLQSCPYACEAGACIGECVPGAQQCDLGDRIPMKCNSRGHWDAGALCQFGCSQGGCVGECNGGDTQCAANSVQRCQASSSPPFEGHWSAPTACDYVCTSGTCGGICKPSSARCSGVAELQTCDSAGQWGPSVSCILGCFPNACIVSRPVSCSSQRTRQDIIIEDFEAYTYGTLRDVSSDLWLPTQGTRDATLSATDYSPLGNGAVIAKLDPVPFTAGVSYRALGNIAAATPAKVSISLDSGVWAFPESEYGVRFGLASVSSTFSILEAVSIHVHNRSVSVHYPYIAGPAQDLQLTNALDYDMAQMTTFRAELDFCAQQLTLYSKRPVAAELLVGSAPIPAALRVDAFFMGATASFGTYVDNVRVAVEQ